MSEAVKKIEVLANNVKALSSALQDKALSALGVFSFSALALAQNKSPVDTGRFRAAWQVQTYKEGGSTVAMELSNNVKYAGVLEYGSPVGGRPWAKPGPLTMQLNGRIWSKQAPGGVLTPRLEEIAQKAAKAVFEGITK